jgi:hypothetical protein
MGHANERSNADRTTAGLQRRCGVASGETQQSLPELVAKGEHTGSSLLPLYWLGSSVVVLLVDLWAGPFLQFPVFFVLPVVLAGWYSSNRWGVGLALALPPLRLSFFLVWGLPYSLGIALTNTVVRIVVLTVIAVLANRAAERTRLLEAEVRILEGIVPICSFCKKMREDDGSWVRLEQYIGNRSTALFSHGVCPECAAEHYGWPLKR